MLMSVSTRPFPLAGKTVSFAAYKSYPAEKALPRVGNLACGESFLTCRGTGPASIVVAVASVIAAATASSTAAGSGIGSASSIVLMRLAGGEVVPFSGTADMIGLGIRFMELEGFGVRSLRETEGEKVGIWMLEGNGALFRGGREREEIKGQNSYVCFFLPAYLLFSLVVQGWKKEVGERKAICLAGLGIGGERDATR